MLVALLGLQVGCGDDDDGAEDTGFGEAAEIGEILSEPDSFDEVTLHGDGTSLGEEGFVLEDASGAIAVVAPGTEARKVEREPLSVDGRVQPLDRFQAEWLRESAAEAGLRDALEGVPLAVGDPYVELVSLSGEGGG